MSNQGERLILRDALDTTIVDFTYQDSWHPVTDGAGFSLVSDSDASQSDWASLSKSDAWQPGHIEGGTPGF